jgi:hypothetical protein
MKMLRTALIVLFSSMIPVTSHAAIIAPETILNDWASTAEPILGRNNASWGMLDANTLTNGGNYSGVKVSDFSLDGDFSFTASITLRFDNDLAGIVFGWQDVGNSYYLSWGGGGFHEGYPGWNGFGDWDGPQLTRFDDGVATTLVAQQQPLWTSGEYDFTASREGNLLKVSLTQGAMTYFSTSVEDDTFLSGRVGIGTFSQGIRLSQAQLTGGGGTDQAVPEPSTLAVWLVLGAVGLAAMRRRKRA